MNTNGCPEGLFTDEIMVFSSTATCTSDVAAWIATSVAFAATKWLVIVGSIKIRRHREALKRSRPSSAPNSKGVPLNLVSLVLGAIVQALFILLASLNIASTRNGLAPFLAGLFFVTVATTHIQQARSIIRLGKRIVPLSLTSYKGGNGSAIEALDKADNMVRILEIAGAVSITCCAVFFAIGLILGGNSPWTFQSGFVCVFGYQFFYSLAIIYHFYRCVKAIRTLEKGTSSDEDGKRTRMSRKDRSIQMAIRAMIIQMVTIAIIASPMIVLSILIAAFVIPVYWYVYVLLYIILDVVLESVLLFAPVLMRRWHRQRPQSTSLATSRQLHSAPAGDVRSYRESGTAVIASTISPSIGNPTE